MPQDAPSDSHDHLDPVRQRAVMATVAVVNELIASPSLDDLDDLIATMEFATDFGVYFDPTLWMRGIDNTREVLGILRSLAQYRHLVVESREQVLAKGDPRGARA